MSPNRACVGCPSKGCKCPSTPCGHSTRAGHGPASRAEPDVPRNMSQYCSVDKQTVPGSPRGSRRTYPPLILPSRFSEHSNESYPGQNNDFYEPTLLPHLFSFKDFLFRSPSQQIKTLFAFQNGHFLMFCFLLFIVKQIIHKSYVMVHFVMPAYCCCCHVNKFFEEEQVQSVFIFRKVWYPQNCKYTNLLLGCVYM